MCIYVRSLNVYKYVKSDREKALIQWLGTADATAPLQIGYAFYDCEEDGTLEVLTNEEYNPQFAEVVENLWDLT